MRLPAVLFAEGGGGRPGDTDYPVVSALDTRAFALWARLSGAGAADRGRRRPLLRRQRGARRLLGPDRRHRGLLARDGRAGDDRGRRPRARSTPTRSARSTVQAPQRRRRPRGRRRGRGDRGGEAAARPTSRATSPAARPADQACCASWSRSASGAPTPSRRRRDARRRGLGDVPARALRAGDGHRAGADRGPRRSGSSPTTRAIWPGRSPATPPTRRRGSCSCATRSGCRSSRCVDTPGMMVGPEAEATAWCATPRGCWSPGRRCGCRWSR